MTTTKFKVGDRVRVVSEKPKGPGVDILWADEMDVFLGAEGQVTAFDVDGNGWPEVRFDGDVTWCFRPEWLTPAVPTQRVRIAVCMDNGRNWAASGWKGAGEKEATTSAQDCHDFLDEGTDLRVVHWVEADVPVPAAAVVEGRVVTDGGEMPTHDLGEPVG